MVRGKSLSTAPAPIPFVLFQEIAPIDPPREGFLLIEPHPHRTTSLESPVFKLHSFLCF